jgi:hypothetical protein
MKLRFDSQSIRLRVRKSDVEKLTQEHFVEEVVHFPTASLVFRLEISPTNADIACEFYDGNIVVRLPALQASEWILSENVGIYGSLPTAQKDVVLAVLVEKDFPCRHNSAADNADTYEELSKS